MNNFFITFLASYLVFVLFAVSFTLILKKGGIKFLIFLAFAVLVALIVSRMTKLLIPYSVRPFKIDGFPPLTLTIPDSPSFPSDHAAVSFALATFIFLYFRKYAPIFMTGAIFVSLGRVLGNVHYPVDILGGAILGVFSALFIDIFVRKWD